MNILAAIGLPVFLVVILVLSGSLLVLASVLIVLLKLGVIAHLWTRPDPEDESSGHTLDQTRDAGQP